MSSTILRYLSMLCLCMVFTHTASAIQLRGTTDIHDPSTIVRDGDRFWTFGTGGGADIFPINALYSYDLINWQRGPSPIPRNTRPGWINSKVPGFDGNFWAPDLIQMNGKFYLYYSAFSATSGMRSAIGVMVTDSLNNPNWRDLGMIVSTLDEPRSSANEPVNAIDAGVFRDANNNVWMVYGSHYAGLYMIQINPNNGLRLNNTRHGVVGNNGRWNEFEAAQVQYINGYYYMFVNLGECCAGNQSTYYIVVGRSTSPTGPYLDKNDRSLWDYGGSEVLSTSGNYIGPGHFGYLNNNGQHLASIHYYDGTTPTGWPGRLDLLQINMSNGWPTFTRNFTLNPVGDGNGNGNTAPIANGIYRITPVHSNKALDVANCGSADGTNVQQWSWLNNDCQKWQVTHLSSGYYRISPVAAPDKALDVDGISAADGANIMLWEYWGGEGQQFRFQSSGSGRWRIIARHSNKCLDVSGMSQNDGANVNQWSCISGGLNQQFQMTRVQ